MQHFSENNNFIYLTAGLVLMLLAGIATDLTGLRYLHLLVLLFFFIWAARVAA